MKKNTGRKIFFRVDASTEIGSGHLMRCLALAQELRKKRAQITFISRRLTGNLNHLIEKNSYATAQLPEEKITKNALNPHLEYGRWLGVDWKTDLAQTAGILKKESQPIDWLIVDHYGLDRQWEEKINNRWVKKIMVIDDLADRRHHCDLLLDQNAYPDMLGRYNGLVPGHCRRLCGPQFALLRDEFIRKRKTIHSRDGAIRRILVFFGATDLTNETAKALQAISGLGRPEIKTDVIIGINNPHKKGLESVASGIPGVMLHYHPVDMAKFIQAADVYIGAAGLTTWERCCLGLPSLVVTVAKNQVEVIEHLSKKNFLFYIGRNSEVHIHDIKKALGYFLKKPRLLKLYSERCLGLVDGQGTRRCAEAILEYEK